MNEENSLFEEQMQQEEVLQVEETPEVQVPEELPVTDPQPQDAPEEELLPEGDPITDCEPAAEETPCEESEPVTDGEATEEVPTEEGEAPVEEAEEAVAEPPEVTEIPYHERYYLKYREGKRTSALDLDGTKAFLQELGFDGGELRQAREGKKRSEDFQAGDKSKNNQMFCSYCGTPIAGVEFFRTPDGRMRCTSCSNTVIKSKAEVEAICQRVMDNMDNFFGATIDVPVSIEVLEERKLKKKVGIGTKDTQSLLILGVAVNEKKKYRILLENGAPRISLIATFAHELTHIWQYTHWDNRKGFKKCDKSKRLLVYEGMAKWAEIQYLYLIGETATARREEARTRERQDEYGIGFCLYEDRYPLCREVMTCEDTPFTPNEYPL